MCGINICDSTDPKDINRMNTDLAHRGTSSATMVVPEHGIALGHIRLPIQGLSPLYDQPINTGDSVYMFVGEFFNFREYDKNAACDAHVLAELYGKHGEIILKSVDGFFSFVVLDKKEKVLRAYVDVLAKKPLYYRTDRFAISSEMLPLMFDDMMVPDQYYMSQVRKWGYPMDNSTPFANIKKLAAGCCLEFNLDTRSMRIRQYDSLYPTPGDIRSLMEKSVKNRLISDVPISLLVSGGLDSSIVYKLAQKHIAPENMTLFHVDNNEEEYLNYLDIPSGTTVKKISAKLYEDGEDAVAIANFSPVDLGSVVPQYCLGREIQKNGFKVTLSGDGADELFGGYQRALDYDSQLSDIHQELVNYHLPRLDKLMMWHTIELRCPFLARSVVEAALCVPRNMRTCKQALKVAFADIVPKEIIERKKEPLKSSDIRKDKLAHRYSLCNKWEEMIKIVLFNLE